MYVLGPERMEVLMLSFPYDNQAQNYKVTQ